ncbi:MAG: recombinase family protein [Clostridia bacterium]|nr:recombinase family protein [Clostridia bacterium]
MRVKIINPSLPEIQPKRLKVCAYCRVSTNSDEQALSLENQTSAYERLIRSNPEYEFAGVYHDRAMTGSKEKRPGFQQMLSDAKAGKINLIITKFISRFARNTVTVLKYSRELREIGVGIFFEEEKLNTLSAEGEVMLSAISAFAEEELRSMSENQKWSVRNRYKEGICNAQGMMGYYKNENGELAINEKQAKIVRRIYDMYINGDSTEKIAKKLNEEKIPTYKNRKWSSRTVGDILKNEKYKGDCKLQKFYCVEPNKKVRNRGEIQSYYIENNHPPIVTREAWDKVQQIMDERKIQRKIGADSTKKYQNRYPLSGLLICPYCGSTLRRKQVHNKRIEWWCSKSIKEGVKACKGIHVRDDDAMAQNITEPIVVKEMMVDGKKYYSYTRKSEFKDEFRQPEPRSKKIENGGLLQSVHRPRRTIIKL